MAITNEINKLNLKSGVFASVVVHVSYGDSGRKVEFLLYDGVDEFTPDRMSVVALGIRFDSAHWGPVSCSYSGNKVSFVLPTTATMSEGPGIAEISITNSTGEKVGSMNFTIYVEKATFPKAVTYSNDPSVFESLLKYAQEVSARAENIIASSGDDNTEIVDARLGYDGKRYNTLGSAIRSQFSNVQSKLDTLNSSKLVYIDEDGDLAYTLGGL